MASRGFCKALPDNEIGEDLGREVESFSGVLRIVLI
jgi:hypothetical protein